jgi:phosphatidate cytidylyltransferase
MRSEFFIRAMTGAVLVSAIVAVILGGLWTWSALLAILFYVGWQEAREALQAADPEQSSAEVYLKGLAMVALPVVGLFFIGWRGNAYESALPLGWFVLLWTNDAAAYLFGRSFGRHKLAPSTSPGKTWEGWAGGAVATLAVAYGLLGVSQGVADLTAAQWAALGAVVSVFGPMGDLLESALKRQAGIKDSGTMLPGHGGVLDRFDSHFISAPIAAILLQLF